MSWFVDKEQSSNQDTHTHGGTYTHMLLMNEIINGLLNCMPTALSLSVTKIINNLTTTFSYKNIQACNVLYFFLIYMIII